LLIVRPQRSVSGEWYEVLRFPAQKISVGCKERNSLVLEVA
jgi:hypothetical protein